jgi:MFS family permease
MFGPAPICLPIEVMFQGSKSVALNKMPKSAVRVVASRRAEFQDVTTMNRERWIALGDSLCYACLTILVWGVNAFQRGLWQDDVVELGQALRRSVDPHYIIALFAPSVAPLRRLTVLPSAIANATPHPIWALQVLCGTVWLCQGWAAGWIVGRLLPGRRWTRFVVVCLTLTATSDFLTGSMVALAYNVAALLLLSAVSCALLWLDHGRIIALIGSSILLASSLLTMDVALPAVPFLALLFVAVGGWRPTRRVITLLLMWGVVLLPITAVEFSFLRDPTSYAAVAMPAMSARTFFIQTLQLWRENFAPWRWAFARPQWYIRPSAVIPAVWMAVGSLVAALIFLIRVHRKSDDASPHESHRGLYLAILFATMALAANAAYALVQLSSINYRTHILARVWASMAIGSLAGWFGTRKPKLRWAAVSFVTAFVFLGTWGGIERQDFFLASWRGHQRELSSIVNTAPALRPGTGVILRSTTTAGRYLATEADYLTMYWLWLLYNDPYLEEIRINPSRGSGCQATADGFDCWSEGKATCFANKTCEPIHFRYEEVVVMDYDPRSGTWHLVPSLRGDPLTSGYDNDAQRYRPEDRIVVQPWTLRQRRLLLSD